MKKYFDFLGYECQDTITEAKGIADSICFDLYGCVQVSLRPKVDKKGDHPQGHWYDAKRIKVVGKKPVLVAPNFSVPAGSEIGAASKASRNI